MVSLKTLPREALRQELESLQEAYQGFKAQSLTLDMSRGKPAPEQLDVSLGLLNENGYKSESGIDARNYGNLEGLPEARRFFGEMLGVAHEEVFVAGNSSLQMMYDMVDLGWRAGFADSPAPWRMVDTEHEGAKPKFLCPAPGYDRHFRITEYFGFELITVPMTPQGPDMDKVEQLALDPLVKGIWCVPMYSNPDGYTYSDDTVRRLARMKTGAVDFKVFWDNAYCVHHLTDTPDVLLNIMDEARACGNALRVLLFCSLSKVTFSGAAVAAMAACKAQLTHIINNLVPMVISFDKLNQLHHVAFLKDQQGLAQHMQKHRAIVEPKFNMVLSLFDAELGQENAYWTKPNGGYFISLYLPDGCAKRTVQLCKQAGVVLTGAGAAYPYGVDPDDSNIRIAPTFPPLAELETASHLLCVCAKIAIVEALLAH